MAVTESSKTNSKSGFTLLEMGIVLLIISTIIGGGLAVFSMSLERSRHSETQEKMKVLQKALLEYRRAFDRLPCPADMTTPYGSATYGIENGDPGHCHGVNPFLHWSYGSFAYGWNKSDVYSGMVPTRALRLPDEAAIDAWGRRIRYVAARDMTSNKDPLPYVRRAIKRDTRFFGRDAYTQGDWWPNFVYGRNGNVLPGESQQIDSYNIMYQVVGATVQTWTAYNDRRELIKYNTSTRKNTFWGNSTQFTIRFVRGIQNAFFVTLYMLDADRTSAEQKVRLYNVSDPTQVYDSRTVSDFGEGVYMTWLINEPDMVEFEIKNMRPTGQAMVSGLFFDAYNPNIFVRDLQNNNITPSANYVLISHGENGHGAYPRNGGTTRINAMSTNTREQSNCNCTVSAADSGTNAYFYQSIGYEDVSTHLDKFDDIVVFATREQLTKQGEY